MNSRISIVTAGAVGLSTALASAVTLHDNGAPDGIGGYSNATAGVFGSRRTLLDDFTLTGGATLQDFHWHSIWNSLPAGSGQSGELTIWSDGGSRPGAPITVANVTGYNEAGTGNTFFSRPEAEHWITFDDIDLSAGTYWLEFTVVGPENNFALTTAVQGNECWVNYDDLGGLMPGTAQFGVAADLSWSLTGAPAPGTAALLALAAIARRRRRRR